LVRSCQSDHPEVRVKFFELLRKLEGFAVHIVIGKKNLNIFNNKHNSNPSEFYFDLLHHLLDGKLNSTDAKYHICLSQRGNNTMHLFNQAVIKAINADNKKRPSPLNINYQLEIAPSKHIPELSIIDYFIWAVQRKLLKGESRYFDALESKYETVISLYEGS
jgi:hypothetical protein